MSTPYQPGGQQQDPHQPASAYGSQPGAGYDAGYGEQEPAAYGSQNPGAYGSQGQTYGQPQGQAPQSAQWDQQQAGYGSQMPAAYGSQPGAGYGPGGYPQQSAAPRRPGGGLLGPLTLRDILLLIGALFGLISLITPFWRDMYGFGYGFENTFLMTTRHGWSLLLMWPLLLIIAGLITLLNKTVRGFPQRIGSLSPDQLISVLTAVAFATCFLEIALTIHSMSAWHVGAYFAFVGALVSFFAGVFTMLPFFAAEFAQRPDTQAHPKARPVSRDAASTAPGLSQQAQPHVPHGQHDQFGAQPQMGQQAGQGQFGQQDQFGAQPGYAAADQQQVGAVSAGYGDPQAYGSQPQAYGSQPQAYGSQPTGYAAQQQAYGSQPTGYDAQQHAYGSQPAAGETPAADSGSQGAGSVAGAVGAGAAGAAATGIGMNADDNDAQAGDFAAGEEPRQQQISDDGQAYLGSHTADAPEHAQSEPTQAFMAGGRTHSADFSDNAAAEPAAERSSDDAAANGLAGADVHDADRTVVADTVSDAPAAAVSEEPAESVSDAPAETADPTETERTAADDADASGADTVAEAPVADTSVSEAPVAETSAPAASEPASDQPATRREARVRGEQQASDDPNEPTQWFRAYERDSSGAAAPTSSGSTAASELADSDQTVAAGEPVASDPSLDQPTQAWIPGADAQAPGADATLDQPTQAWSPATESTTDTGESAEAVPSGQAQPFWFAVPEPREAIDPSTGRPLFTVTPGEWFLALSDNGTTFTVRDATGQEGLLRNLEGIQRG
ncbi:hypothetical protein [Brevibacterium luteolum]|uniref:hypothetical protein n=1 Tax=Brevibacterium luteolum TaxID=199591 RepID=UPI00223BD97A|nr:hypothetical protein [Brevibacterium luteolum]MCT1874029.1 hypothetical protein [Brevibacterium luteolum]MCT1891779.1 hypothetical protein [Brevibacterium luteolum]MCT1893231.1 hypothetical protein [Brevibacterium luteolum]MCT1925205.1 hypothetical protein [Brevibacterium luteolum]